MKPKFINHTSINLNALRNSSLTGLLVLVSFFAFSQSNPLKGMNVKEAVKAGSMAITVTVDSAEDLEATFRLEDLKDILKESGDNHTLSFEIICNKANTSKGLKSHVSYKFEGNTNQSEEFLKYAERMRLAALNYYKQN